jgi:hypothetical protein
MWVGGGLMIMHMRLFRVLLLLIIAIIVVAVRQARVVVLMRVPIRPVLELDHRAGDAADVVVGHVIVIVRMDDGWMGMLRLLAFAFGSLPSRHCVPPSPSLLTWPLVKLRCDAAESVPSTTRLARPSSRSVRGLRLQLLGVHMDGGCASTSRADGAAMVEAISSWLRLETGVIKAMLAMPGPSETIE